MMYVSAFKTISTPVDPYLIFTLLVERLDIKNVVFGTSYFKTASNCP